MKSGRFFWASFLICLGAILLLSRFSLFVPEWQAIWRFWPLMLVLWGGAILSRGSKFAPVAAALAGLILAALGAALIDWCLDFDGGGYVDRPARTQEFAQPFDEGVRRASFRFESGAGSFNLEGTTAQLVEATVYSGFGRYVMRGDRIEQSEDVSLRLEGERRGWTFSRSGNRVTLRFNPLVPWDMKFAVGASRLDLDFSPLLVERVSLEAGASQVRVRLGDRSDEMRLAVSSGVSSVRILVPHSSACEINADSPLSRKSFKDFSRTNEGTYRTENFASSAKKVFISLQSGISNLTVVRY